MTCLGSSKFCLRANDGRSHPKACSFLGGGHSLLEASVGDAFCRTCSVPQMMTISPLFQLVCTMHAFAYQNTNRLIYWECQILITFQFKHMSNRLLSLVSNLKKCWWRKNWLMKFFSSNTYMQFSFKSAPLGDNTSRNYETNIFNGFGKDSKQGYYA